MAKSGGDPEKRHVSGQSNRPLSRPAHALTHEQLAAELDADILSGLTPQEAKVRLEQYGSNDLGEEEGVQPLKIIVAQIANAMTLVTVPICRPNLEMSRF
jgi:magnesium-transporting ATPase (P-type)